VATPFERQRRTGHAGERDAQNGDGAKEVPRHGGGIGKPDEHAVQHDDAAEPEHRAGNERAIAEQLAVVDSASVVPKQRVSREISMTTSRKVSTVRAREATAIVTRDAVTAAPGGGLLDVRRVPVTAQSGTARAASCPMDQHDRFGLSRRIDP
jgi:hypothetical protein